MCQARPGWVREREQWGERRYVHQREVHAARERERRVHRRHTVHEGTGVVERDR
jgi:hypothetical protein